MIINILVCEVRLIEKQGDRVYITFKDTNGDFFKADMHESFAKLIGAEINAKSKIKKEKKQ